MDKMFDLLLEEILALDHDSQIAIAETIIARETDREQYDEEWREELRSRDEGYRRGEIPTVAHSEIMMRARREVAEKAR